VFVKKSPVFVIYSFKKEVFNLASSILIFNGTTR